MKPFCRNALFAGVLLLIPLPAFAENSFTLSLAKHDDGVAHLSLSGSGTMIDKFADKRYLGAGVQLQYDSTTINPNHNILHTDAGAGVSVGLQENNAAIGLRSRAEVDIIIPFLDGSHTCSPSINFEGRLADVGLSIPTKGKTLITTADYYGGDVGIGLACVEGHRALVLAPMLGASQSADELYRGVAYRAGAKLTFIDLKPELRDALLSSLEYLYSSSKDFDGTGTHEIKAEVRINSGPMFMGANAKVSLREYSGRRKAEDANLGRDESPVTSLTFTAGRSW